MCDMSHSYVRHRLMHMCDAAQGAVSFICVVYMCSNTHGLIHMCDTIHGLNYTCGTAHGGALD